MFISTELYENKVLGQVMPYGYKYNEINMKLEEEEDEEVEKIEDLKEKQKRLKQEIRDRKRSEKAPEESVKPN